MAGDELDPRFGLVPDPVPPDPMIGRLLEGKYEVLRLIGSGGMGSVYEGQNRRIGRRVAIKVLHRELCSNADIVQRFVREARAATSIGHPHIVEVLDMGTVEGGGFFQVLELLEGRSLADELEAHGPMSYVRAVKILSQVTDALAATHDKGIVHRDLKPDNVFLVTRPEDPDFVKLLDFGIAKVADAAGGSKTRTGLTLGTAAYMSPEQARGASDTDHRTDIFALGVMTYELLTGTRPFHSDSYAGIIFQICSAEPPPLSSRRRDVPPGLDAVIARMLAKHRDDRFADCREVKRALAPFATHAATPVSVSVDVPMARLSTLPSVETDAILDPRTGRAPERGRATTSSNDALGTGPLGTGPLGTGPLGTGPLRASAAPRPSSEVVGVDAIPGMRRSWRPIVLLGSLVGVMGLALVGWAFSTTRDVSSAESAREGRVALPAPPPEGSETALVHLAIRTDPASATLFVDDVAVSNPYVVDVAPSSEAHVVEARLAGHAPAHRAFTEARSLDMTLALAPLLGGETATAEIAASAPTGTSDEGARAHAERGLREPATRDHAGGGPAPSGRVDPAPIAVAASPTIAPAPARTSAGSTGASAETQSLESQGPESPATETDERPPPQALKRVRF
ncbi:MAG: protein kinase [Sandaracinaceae bacterium]|nr:protein kinase [Sandaracinaceae bacterium]